jgi:death-on-curing protein
VAPIFLTLDEVVEIHRDMIERYGGSAGIRDLDLLESAIAMPQAGMGDQYFHSTLFEMAAAYLFHIVQNHPFVDGNKRVGAMAAFVFLKLNGFAMNAKEAEFERMVRQIAEGQSKKAQIAIFFQQNTKRLR